MAAGFTAIRSNPLAFLEQVRLRYGDLVAFPVPGSPALLVSDPEAVRGILQGNARRWTKNTVQYAALATVTGPGLLAVSDDRWLRRRRAAQPAFHHGRLGTIGDSVATAAATVVGSWQGMPASGTEIDVDALALGITLDVVGRTLFDRDLTEQTERLVHATDEAAELVVAQAQTVPLPAWVPTTAHRRLRAAVSELDSICRDLTAERRARGVGEHDSDLLGLLISAGLDDDGIRDELVTMVVAGHETVASALTWTLMLLAENPAAQDRLREEVRALDTLRRRCGCARSCRGRVRSSMSRCASSRPAGWCRGGPPSRMSLQDKPFPRGPSPSSAPGCCTAMPTRGPTRSPSPRSGSSATPRRWPGPTTCRSGSGHACASVATSRWSSWPWCSPGCSGTTRSPCRNHGQRPAINAFVTLRPRGGLTLRVRPV